MYINKLIIHNFKGFKHFEMDFSDNVNVIVGNNNEGKTTIFEAIHLALTASINGKNVLADIPAHIFNKDAVNEYLAKIKAGEVVAPPKAGVELFFSKKVDNNYYVGNNNSKVEKSAGVKIIFELNPNCVEDIGLILRTKKMLGQFPLSIIIVNGLPLLIMEL